jgi:cellulose synthase/poly-beta-1,6-N-acetylglucosamine synthase-like glycosyltransferase
MDATIRNPDWKSRKKLGSQTIVAFPQTILSADAFLKSPDPVAWIVRRGSVLDPETFYAELAKLFELPYRAELPFYLNPIGAPLPKLTLQTMAEELVFHFYENSRSYLAIANPCLPKKTFAALLAQLPDDTTIVLSPHGVIKEALSYYNAYYSANAVEHALPYARPEHSSKIKLTQKMFKPLIAVGILGLTGTVLFKGAFYIFIYIVINSFYFLMNPFKIFLFVGGARKELTEHFVPGVIEDIDESILPYYTLLIPLKEEARILPQLIVALRSLQYPIEKLDVKIAVEASDHSTLAGLAELGLSSATAALATPENILFHVVKVPEGSTSTKPRSCNFALQLARGTITVIYDAEDQPDPLQLKKAWYVFMNSKLNTLCVQSKLTYYNTKRNLLTRFFTLEYGFWFDTFLPGLQALHIPLPLGGTSNHFLTANLRRIGGWDSFNVTEDADLGWRLSRFNYRTVVMDSYTYEEAMSKLWGWIKQRTRWQKGFIVTFLVHSQNIPQLYRELGLWRCFSSLLIFSSTVFMPLINPLLWLLFIHWYVFPLIGLPRIGFTTAPWVGWIGNFNLIVGNVAYIIIHIWVALKQKRYSLLPFALLMPFYWPLLSIATYRAMWQFLFAPSHWEKTTHGLGD